MADVEQAQKQKLESLKRVYQGIRDKGVMAQAEVSRLTPIVAEMSATSKEKFGTDDSDELGRISQKMADENNTALSDFEAELNKIQSQLDAISVEFR